jgi:hypothetical protein
VPKLRKVHHEKFAQAVASGLNASEAYRKVSGNSRNANVHSDEWSRPGDKGLLRAVGCCWILVWSVANHEPLSGFAFSSSLLILAIWAIARGRNAHLGEPPSAHNFQTVWRCLFGSERSASVAKTLL